LVKKSGIRNTHQKLGYHVTVGVVENVRNVDVPGLKRHIIKLLKGSLSSSIPSNFGVADKPEGFAGGRLLVLRPKQPSLFLKLNQSLRKNIAKMIFTGNKRYTFNPLTSPKLYKPHVTIGAWSINAYNSIVRSLQSYRLKNKKDYTIPISGFSVF
jgi:hypothetical protein